MKAVVVTGASTGIGRACVDALAKADFHVFGSVRKAVDADRLKQDLGDSFTPLIFDVTDPAAVQSGAEKARQALAGRTLCGLVNNAGVAVAGPMLELPLSEFRQQVEVNLMGVVAVTQAFAPLLGVDKALQGLPGRIVNISSISGKIGNPFMAPYCASKFAVEGLSESLRRELMIYGIDVVVIAPGAVKTPIWSKAEEIDVTPYAHSPYARPLDDLLAYLSASGANGLPPDAIGDTVVKALTSPRPKPRYTVVPNPAEYWMARILPARLVDRIFRQRLGLAPPLDSR